MCVYTRLHSWWGQWQDLCQCVKCIINAGDWCITLFASWECACLLPYGVCVRVGQCVKHIDNAVEDAGITAYTALKAGIFCR